jgi:cellulose synthase/poly-beta-1,6-N-acetylglucosamine synthase-like glycosyltransferase
MELALIIIYGLSMLFIMVFSLVQLNLAIIYRKKKSGEVSSDIFVEAELTDQPVVTVQLPIYNEQYVVERLIKSVCAFKWPKNKLEIQILDDSNDVTTEIIKKQVSNYQSEGFDIKHVRRPDRIGFKAGALQYGLEKARGEFIAIFDADFLPLPDFLNRTMNKFTDPKVGMVQTKWEHLNKSYSLLTQLQAFGLNGHFSIEQTGRNSAGSFINFNGTAGIWRKTCIESAGGWQTDTITEDLDLSYRAQLKGWDFKYVENVGSPAELPVVMSAVKSQQFRWNKGGAETAKKILPGVLTSKVNLQKKIHAFFHLTNSTNFLFLLIASIVSIPLLFVKEHNPQFRLFFDVGSIFLVGFLSISYFYWIATKYTNSEPGIKFIKYYPLFLIFSMGLALHNGIAVIEGLLGKKTPFVRTPKFNIIGADGQWKQNIYVHHRFTWMTALEGFLSLYFVFGIVLGIMVADYGLMLFHLMLALGYAGIFYYTLKS